MIGNTNIGKSFGGCTRYVMEGRKGEEKDRAELLMSEGVRTDTTANMVKDFNYQRIENPELGKAVWHTSLSFHETDKDKLNNQIMKEIAEKYLKGMNLDNTQYIVVKHNDTEHPHLHLIANRVDNEGKTISDSQNFYRSEQLCKEITREYGLYQTQGKDLTKTNLDKLPGEQATKYEIYKEIKEQLSHVKSLPELKEQLEKKDIEMRIRYNQAGEVKGASFEKDGNSFKASEIDRNFSAKNLEQAINQNKEQTQKQDINLNRQSIIDKAGVVAEAAKSPTEFIKSLEKENIKVTVERDITGKAKELHFEYNGEKYKGSELNTNLKAENLTKQLKENQEQSREEKGKQRDSYDIDR